jgi:hypothetical protein
MIEDNVTARENQYCDINEEPTRRGERSVGTKKCKTGLVGAFATKGGERCMKHWHMQ